ACYPKLGKGPRGQRTHQHLQRPQAKMPQISKRLGLPGVHLTRFHNASVVQSIYPYYRITQYAGLASLPARGKPADETSDHSRYSVHQGETGKRNVLSVLEVVY